MIGQKSRMKNVEVFPNNQSISTIKKDLGRTCRAHSMRMPTGWGTKVHWNFIVSAQVPGTHRYDAGTQIIYFKTTFLGSMEYLLPQRYRSSQKPPAAARNTLTWGRWLQGVGGEGKQLICILWVHLFPLNTPRDLSPHMEMWWKVRYSQLIRTFKVGFSNQETSRGDLPLSTWVTALVFLGRPPIQIQTKVNTA